MTATETTSRGTSTSPPSHRGRRAARTSAPSSRRRRHPATSRPRTSTARRPLWRGFVHERKLLVVEGEQALLGVGERSGQGRSLGRCGPGSPPSRTTRSLSLSKRGAGVRGWGPSTGSGTVRRQAEESCVDRLRDRARTGSGTVLGQAQGPCFDRLRDRTHRPRKTNRGSDVCPAPAVGQLSQGLPRR